MTTETEQFHPTGCHADERQRKVMEFIEEVGGDPERLEWTPDHSKGRISRRALRDAKIESQQLHKSPVHWTVNRWHVVFDLD